jgi:hypothetical protein
VTTEAANCLVLAALAHSRSLLRKIAFERP